MAKTRTIYVCTNCGEETITWQGRCPVCQTWNSLKEFTVSPPQLSRSSVSLKPLKPLDLSPDGSAHRLETGSAEFDRVLGGGIVPGSVILLGGEPGIGKSTLLLQVGQKMSRAGTVIYFSGEESETQVATRARRLGIKPRFLFRPETRVDDIEASLGAVHPRVAIVDSIQTLYDEALPSTPGSLVQVREGALRLQGVAKQERVSLFLVGHITKEGTMAGPKTLEHMVDVVLYLEGEARTETRILRCFKNRFGATYEVGLFALEEEGLKDIPDPTDLFVDPHGQAMPGTALTAVMEGIRPIIVEVQALAVPTPFGLPRRTSVGIDLQRLHILLAVLDRHMAKHFATYDVFVNVVGGYRIFDRRADAAVCLALLSATSGVALPPKQVIYGEIGLTGELRRGPREERLEGEVKRLGYTPMPRVSSLQELGETLLDTRDRHDRRKSR